MRPHARKDGLLVQEVGDELVIYDQERHRAHRLNQTAALVFRHCDGQTTVKELATLLQTELDVPADEEMVWLALDRLDKAHLLRERLTRPAGVAGVSRRQVVRRLAKTAALALLPVVTTLMAPTPAMAGTVVLGCCQIGTGCASPVTAANCASVGGVFFPGLTCTSGPSGTGRCA